MKVKIKIVLFFVFLIGQALSANFAFASITNGTIDPVDKYAWSEKAGWLNFNCPSCDIHITDASLTGYIWSENYGWINLNPSTGGVLNTGEGVLSGFAWAENLGWVNFDGVTINSSGDFLGYATISADGSKISFNCLNITSCALSNYKVKTDWRPQSERGTVTVVANDLPDLTSLGYVTPVGEATNTTQVVYEREVQAIVPISQGTVEITTPSQTVVTKSDGGNFDFTQLFAEEASTVVSNITGQTVLSALKYGLSNVALSFDQPVNIVLPVSSQYNGEVLNVYKSESSNGGWFLLTTCTVSGGDCSFDTLGASYFVVSKPTGSGGMPTEWNNPPTSPAGGFKVLINDNAKYTKIPTINLSLLGGPNTKKMAISNFSDFKNTSQEDYIQTKTWNLCEGLTFCSEGEYAVYVKFYAPWGKSSEVILSKIIYKKEVSIIKSLPLKTKLSVQPSQKTSIKKIYYSCSFQKDLKFGMISKEIKCLQVFLNSDPQTRVAQVGHGSPNKETNYFGSLTKKAVIKFQKKYLQKNKVTGLIDATTKAQINKIVEENKKF